MATFTTSLAEGLARAHATLLKDLEKLAALGEDRATTPKALRDELAAVQKHIAEHFRFEEQNGYMNAVTKREPQHERAIEKLREEHGELAQSLATLLDETDGPTIAESVREHVRAWLRLVESHETHENALVQEVFNRDTWAED